MKLLKSKSVILLILVIVSVAVISIILNPNDPAAGEEAGEEKDTVISPYINCDSIKDMEKRLDFEMCKLDNLKPDSFVVINGLTGQLTYNSSVSDTDCEICVRKCTSETMKQISGESNPGIAGIFSNDLYLEENINGTEIKIYKYVKDDGYNGMFAVWDTESFSYSIAMSYPQEGSLDEGSASQYLISAASQIISNE